MRPLAGASVIHQPLAGAAGYPARAGLTRPASTRDDVPLHRREDRNQFLLLARRHLELVQGLAEVLHQRIEMLVLDAHAGMDRAHVAAGIGARAARSLADLLDQARL